MELGKVTRFKLLSRAVTKDNATTLIIVGLLLLWAIAQFIWYLKTGIVKSVDTSIYISNGKLLSAGIIPEGNDKFYLSYCAVIALLETLHLKAEWIILIQIISSSLALICLCKLTKMITKSNASVVISGLLYVFWFKFYQWNLILYTDSLFTSFVIISFYQLFQSKTNLSYILSALLIIFTTLIRPTGIGFILAVIIYLMNDSISIKNQNKWQVYSIISLALTASLLIVNQYLSGFIDSFISSYSKAEIIYPDITMGVKPNTQLIIPSKAQLPLLRFTLFIFNNTLYFLKISLIKGGLFLCHVKPYYSTWHNIYISLSLLPVYTLSLRSILWVKSSSKYFAVSFIVLQTLVVAFTSENWDGRFLLPVLPCFFLLASTGVLRSSKKMTKNNSSLE